ncbi:MAG: hypothetical protein K0R34_3299 [Herbinix sp.]|jgi:hypothetical protein|nr:hypothetical protein [Herbinix sp.]
MKPRKHRVGDPSSKYGYEPHKLDSDIERNRYEKAKFKMKLRELLLSEPDKLDIRYHQAIEELRSIKDEFGL